MAELQQHEEAQQQSPSTTAHQGDDEQRELTDLLADLNLMNASGDFCSPSASKSSSVSSPGTNRTNLIVNYLPPNMTQDEVKSLFTSVGELSSCKLICHRVTGESLGYAFVKYQQAKDADRAVETLNGLRLQSKTIKVSLARPSCEAIQGANLYICGLPKQMSQVQLEQLFGQYGRIITARILCDPHTGQSRGVAFIRFDKRHEAQLAINQLHGHQFEPRSQRLMVKYANAASAGQSVAGAGPDSQLFMNFLRQALSLCPQQVGPSWAITVSNLGPEVEDFHMWQIFGPFGAVQSVKLDRHGFALVRMSNYEEALLAVHAVDGFILHNRALKVSFNFNFLDDATASMVLPVSTAYLSSKKANSRSYRVLFKVDKINSKD